MKIKSTIDIKKDLHFFVLTQLNKYQGWEVSPSDIKIFAELHNIDAEMVSSGNVKSYEDRMSILFSSETKKRIMDKLDMSYNTFSNGLSRLRKKGLITKDNTINEKRLRNLNKQSYVFTIEFTHEEGKEEEVK
jgi:DNA-binding transcriptional ArsR family regulator